MCVSIVFFWQSYHGIKGQTRCRRPKGYIERGIVWSENNIDVSIENNDGIVYNGSGSGKFKDQITDLLPNKSYCLRAFATNSIGTSYGSAKWFLTLSGRPTVTTTPVTDITSESAICGGIVQGEGDAQVTERGVVWRLEAFFPYPTLDDSFTVDGSGAGEFSSLITELSSSRLYDVRAYAKNAFGVSYGNTIKFRSKAAQHFPCPDAPNVTDSDGNIYNTVLIGNQCWMIENLKTTKYRNNTHIDAPDNYFDWHNNATGAYGWYDFDIKWKNKYGALYNWHAVNNANSLCPAGWHIPSDAEWTQLWDYIGAQGFLNENGNAFKSCRQEYSHLGGVCNTSTHPRWDYYLSNFGGFDAFGFSALPGGFCSDNYNEHNDIGKSGYWWSATEINSAYVWTRRLYHSSDKMGRGWGNKRGGYSVRCIKD